MIARLAVVGRAGSDFDALIAAAMDRAAGRPVDLTIVVVARQPLAWAFASLTGRVTPEQLSRDAHEAGAAAARRALRRLVGDVSARYIVVEGREQLRRSLCAAPGPLDVVLVDRGGGQQRLALWHALGTFAAWMPRLMPTSSSSAREPRERVRRSRQRALVCGCWCSRRNRASEVPRR